MSDDSFLSAGGFTRGQERRRSARIPLTKPVRVGIPGGLPQSPVSAADLSLGGLFIDADRPVRVGARFSVQIPLASGTSVYVEEAEVVYNRQAASAPGFGVRFVRMSPSSEDAIRQEVARLSPRTLPKGIRVAPRSGFGSSLEEAPTLVPAAFGGDVAAAPVRPREPSIIDAAAQGSSLGPADLSGRPASVRSRWRVEAQDWFWRHARSMGLAFSALAAITVLTATVVFLGTTPSPTLANTDGAPLGAVPSDTHRALMDAETPVTEVVPPPPRAAPSGRKRPLPGLVEVDRLGAAGPTAASEPLDHDDLAYLGEDEGEGDEFAFRLSPDARVKRTMIYRSPERFVVDLADQDPRFMPKMRARGGIRRFRVGRHPGFVRLVLDAAQPIQKASAEVDGNELRVSVTYK